MNSHVSRRKAFSLIELIIVIAVIAIIATFTMPAMNTVLRGSHMAQGSGLLISQLSLARQQALARNRIIEVRFYRFADPEAIGETKDMPSTGKFRAMQVFEIQNAGGVALPIDKIQRLPGPIVFAYTDTPPGLSSLLDKSASNPLKAPGDKDLSLPREVGSKYEYVSFRFMPDGSTDKSPTGKWFVTLINQNDKLDTANKPPPNFFTVQIDPVSGTTRAYRPTVGG